MKTAPASSAASDYGEVREVHAERTGRKSRTLFDRAILGEAAGAALAKLNPRTLARNG